MADVVWGLEERGHSIIVLSSDAPYLPKPPSDFKLKAKIVRKLILKGHFHNGVHHLKEPTKRREVDLRNNALILSHINEYSFDGILLGNLDLLGPEILHSLESFKKPVLHHIGFINPPFALKDFPSFKGYKVIAASNAVKTSLIEYGIKQSEIPIVYPGARCDLFDLKNSRSLPYPLGKDSENSNRAKLGSKKLPLKVCFAGLIMSTKGVHTLIEAMAVLKKEGVEIEIGIAGGDFQKDYCKALKGYLAMHGLEENSYWYGQLGRPQLARFFKLFHVAVFPSIHPEAFGIVAVEAMASGLVLISSGVGGSSEVLEDEIHGFKYEAGNSKSLAMTLKKITQLPYKTLNNIARKGKHRAKKYFSVESSAKQLEQIFQADDTTF